MLNEKELIAINNEFSNGNIVNQNSLKYVINELKRTNSWIRQLALLTRAILIDHIFEEGNKRTAAAVIATCLDEKDYNYSPEEINKLIVNILKKNITDINKIERLIENVIN